MGWIYEETCKIAGAKNFLRVGASRVIYYDKLRVLIWCKFAEILARAKDVQKTAQRVSASVSHIHGSWRYEDDYGKGNDYFFTSTCSFLLGN